MRHFWNQLIALLAIKGVQQQRDVVAGGQISIAERSALFAKGFKGGVVAQEGRLHCTKELRVAGGVAKREESRMEPIDREREREEYFVTLPMNSTSTYLIEDVSFFVALLLLLLLPVVAAELVGTATGSAAAVELDRERSGIDCD